MRIVKVNDFFKELKKFHKKSGFVSMNDVHQAMKNCVTTDRKFRNEIIEEVRTKCMIYYSINSSKVMSPDTLDMILNSLKEGENHKTE